MSSFAPKRSRSGRAWLGAFALALAAHLLAILLIQTFGWFDLIPTARPLPNAAVAAGTSEAPLEIQTLVDELKTPDRRSAAEEARAERRKKEENDKDPHGQVVDVPRPLIEQRPDQAKYVSEHDTKVDHETKRFGREPGASGTVPPTPPAGTPGEEGAGGRPGPLTMREREAPVTHGSAESLPIAPDGHHSHHGASQASQTPRHRVSGEEGDGATGAARGRPNLTPTAEMLARAIGKPGGTMDYLKGVDDGDTTALNSKKWKNAPFFNRVKRAVAEEWHPEMVYVQHDPNGNVYGVKDRVTVLRIHLSPNGKLAGWTMMQSSGIDFLDDEAIDAFKKASPFLNPPKDLVDEDGKIHFNFAFIFELSGRGSLKIFKY